MFFLIFSFSIQAKGILDRVISIEIKSAPVHFILSTIEEKGKVQFSYNPNLIDENRIVSLSLVNKTIRYGLELIFENTVQFKEVGNHIVLTPAQDIEDQKARKKTDETYAFTGTVTNARDGKPVHGASVYEVEGHFATFTQPDGSYLLEVPATSVVKTLYIRKEGFSPSVIVLDGTNPNDRLNNVSLVPEAEVVVKLEPSEIEKIDVPLDDKVIPGLLVSDEVFQHGKNLKDIEEKRAFQISLVPALGVGSDLAINSLVINHFSFNILGGYSKGVEGAEIGGIFNLVKEDVVGGQLGGIANLVGGDIIGAQVGGISNLVQGSVKGAQVSGISSILKRDLIGAQVSGINSVIRGGFYGVQFSGICNFVHHKSVGLQVGGIYNMTRDSILGGQIGGISNVSGGVSFFQIGGISNYAGTNNGVQIGGIFNHARQNNGLQVGLINTSRNSKGISLGLINFVKEGYHKTEISANEYFPVNLTFKSGIKRFYNTYDFSVRFGDVKTYAAGLGFGSYFDLHSKWSLSLDLGGQLAVKSNISKFRFDQLYKATLTLDFHAAKWITFFAGPSLNINVIQFTDDNGAYTSDIHVNPIYDHSFTAGRTLLWLGGQVGIRL